MVLVRLSVREVRFPGRVVDVSRAVFGGGSHLVQHREEPRHRVVTVAGVHGVVAGERSAAAKALSGKR